MRGRWNNGWWSGVGWGGWSGVGWVEWEVIKTIMKTLFSAAMTQLQAQISLEGVRDVSLTFGEFEAHTPYLVLPMGLAVSFMILQGWQNLLQKS